MKCILGAGGFQQLFSLASPEISYSNFKKFPRSRSNRINFPSRFDLDTKNHVFLHSSQIASASSASISGSSADYPEQLLEVQRKKRSIAWVDQDELKDPTNLADPDSCFCEFRGVNIHHKVYDVIESKTEEAVSSQTKKVGFPMILLHGFGASVFSWNKVMKPLAEVTGSKVLAFDRPAFGLTSRLNPFDHSASSGNGDTKPLNLYSMAFSVLATLYFVDHLVAEKAILVGHSAGCLVAVDTYFEAPERVAALILIAPAILAPRSMRKVGEGNQSRGDNQIEEKCSSSNGQGNPLIRSLKIFSKFSKMIANAIFQMVKLMTHMLNSLYKKLLSTILRSALAVMLVRMVIDKFGITAIRNAWYDPNKVTEHVLDGYTKPLRAKGWDRALVEYTAAMLADTAAESKPPLAKRLHEISCPVLIVTGDNDRLVPSWNAERLSKAIPGSCFEIIKQCGHLPHEEKVDEFVTIVQKFLQRTFGLSEEQYMQVVA